MIEIGFTHLKSEKGALDITDIFKSCHVYLLFNQGKIVYVGQSRTVGSRIHNHFKEKVKEFDRIFSIPVSPQEMTRLEAALIRVFRPKHNVVSNNAEASEADFMLAMDYGIYGFEGGLIETAKFKDTSWGPVLVVEGELAGQVGYYDDDDFSHSAECDEYFEELGLERWDLSEEKAEELCDMHSCGCKAVVYFGSFVGGEYYLIPYDHLRTIVNPTEEFEARMLERLHPGITNSESATGEKENGESVGSEA